MDKANLVKFIYGIADNNLILGQRLGELCGHAPNIETDIALTNISLDLLGQTRNYFQYGAKLLGNNKTEDDLAMLRKEHEYRNILLVEQPNTDFAYVIVRQFLYDNFHILLLQKLQNSNDEQIASITKKAIKEVTYHVRFSAQWMRRLGDGTSESHQKMQTALDNLWEFTNELFQMEAPEVEAQQAGIGVNLQALKSDYYQQIGQIINEASLTVPELKYFKKGGKTGTHSEHMGYILAELQYMQRTYPNMTW